MMWSRIKNALPQPYKRRLRQIVQNTLDTARYRLIKKKAVDFESIHHVIFICKGNICRSAFAEYYLRRQFLQESLIIESCGLDVDQGTFSPAGALAVAKEFGLELDSHRSKGISCCSIHNADLILPMEFGQYLRLIAMFPECKSKIRLLRDFSPWRDRFFCNIDDPYGGGDHDFRRCFIQLQKALDGLKIHG